MMFTATRKKKEKKTFLRMMFLGTKKDVGNVITSVPLKKKGYGFFFGVVIWGWGVLGGGGVLFFWKGGGGVVWSGGVYGRGGGEGGRLSFLVGGEFFYL